MTVFEYGAIAMILILRLVGVIGGDVLLSGLGMLLCRT